jgi:hypothetical protein
MRKLIDVLQPNHYLRSLNLAYNPVAKGDNLEALCKFIRNNSSLQHIDLSGVL